jgi:hypothetical protein
MSPPKFSLFDKLISKYPPAPWNRLFEGVSDSIVQAEAIFFDGIYIRSPLGDWDILRIMMINPRFSNSSV